MVFNYSRWERLSQFNPGGGGQFSSPGSAPPGGIGAQELGPLVGMPPTGNNMGGNTNTGDGSLVASNDNEIKEALQDAAHFKDDTDDANALKDRLANLAQNSSNQSLSKILVSLMNKIGPMSNASKPTSDPLTGQQYQTMQECAQEALDNFDELLKSDGNSTMAKIYNHYHSVKLAAPEFQKGEITPQEKSLQEHEEDKKKHGGDPFKVLLGMVETLINGGVRDPDIIHQIKKEGNWDEDLIRKAIHYVKETKEKEYNEEKLHPKKQVVHKKPKMETMEEAFHGRVPFASRTASREGEGTIYAVKPDYSKRSVGELMMRARFLIGVQNYGPSQKQGDSRKVADKSGVAAELKQIKSALSEFGFSDKEIGKLLATANTNPTANGFDDYDQDTK